MNIEVNPTQESPNAPEEKSEAGQDVNPPKVEGDEEEDGQEEPGEAPSEDDDEEDGENGNGQDKTARAGSGASRVERCGEVLPIITPKPEPYYQVNCALHVWLREPVLSFARPVRKDYPLDPVFDD